MYVNVHGPESRNLNKKTKEKNRILISCFSTTAFRSVRQKTHYTGNAPSNTSS